MEPKRHNPSLWMRSGVATDYPSLQDERRVEVVVVGGGITGLSTAYRLQTAGIQVALLEGGKICSGVTGYTTAKVTALHNLPFKRVADSFDMEVARHYAEANLAAVEQVAEWVEALSIDCECVRCPAYTFTTQSAQASQIREEVATARALGLSAYFTQETELPLPVKGAICLPDQLRIDPYKYCVGLVRALEAAGGQIFENSRVVKVDKVENSWLVQTSTGKVWAPHVVLATLIPFLDRGGFFARAVPERSYLVAAQLNEPVHLEGMYISSEQPTRSLRQASHGEFLLVGGEHHKTGQEPDTTKRYEVLKAWTREHFRVQAFPYQWSAQDYTPVDGLPYIGQMPLSDEHLWLATGFAKWGMSWGTAAAMMISDRILGRDNPWSSTFDAKRIKLVQSAKRMVSAGVNVVQRFVGDRIKHLQAPPIEQLGFEEGGVVKKDGKRIGAYRDADGTLHTVSLVCPHMGCHVNWNEAEKSWDCPCHGSRFSAEGRLLQGPAVSDLPSEE